MNVTSIFSRRAADRPVIPAALRRRFAHLIWDIAWYGILNGSAIAFVGVFAVRLGASPLQIGLLTAMPAVMNLLVALPAGRWLQARPLTRAVFWTSIGQRWFYLFYAVLPFLLGPRAQIWTLIVVTIVMSIPGTALAIGFNALYAAAVPEEYRGLVAGRRNAAYALASIVATVLSGFLLSRLPFPLGYQVVFAVGFVAALASSLHLRAVHVSEANAPRLRQRLGDLAGPGGTRIGNDPRPDIGLRSYMVGSSLRLAQRVRDLGHFRTVLSLVALVHLTLFLGAPLFPIYFVQELGLSDRWIGIGNGVFYVALFLGSMRLAAVSRALGHRGALALGMLVISFYPVFLSLADGVELYLVASVVGGVAWSLVFGSLGNYVLEMIPEETRSTYLALHNMALQAGILVGSLTAPLLAGWVGLTPALLIAAGARLAVGVLLWRRG